MDNDPTKNIMKPLQQLIWLLNAALILYIFSGTERHILKDFFLFESFAAFRTA